MSSRLLSASFRFSRSSKLLQIVDQPRPDDLVDERAEPIHQVVDDQVLKGRREKLGRELVLDPDGEVGAVTSVGAFPGEIDTGIRTR